MRRAVAAAVVVGVCLTGTSCTDDSGASSPDSPHSTDTTTTSDPPTTSGPTDGPPELPEAAKAKTTAGAKAFVKYYVDVLNYSWDQLAPAPLAKASSKRCRPCNLILKQIQITAQRGGHQAGGDWTLDKVYLLPGSSPNSLSFLATIRISSGSYVESSGDEPTKIVAGEVTNQVDVSRSRGRWQASDMRST